MVVSVLRRFQMQWLTQVTVRQVGDSGLHPAASTQVVLENSQHILVLLQDGVSLLQQLLRLQQRIVVWRGTRSRARRRLWALASSSTLCSAAAHAGGGAVLLLLASGND
jgi:hypothetical protein